MRHKKCAAMYAGKRVAVLAASVEMRLNRERRWPMFCMFWCWPGRSQGDTVDASDDDDADWLIYRGRRWCPWLIRESVRPTQWPWPAAARDSDYRHMHTVTVASVTVHVKLIVYFFFLLQVHYWLDLAPVAISRVQAPYPRAPCTLTTVTH